MSFLCGCCDKGFHPSSVTINGNSYGKLALIGEGGRGYIYSASLPSSTVAALGLGGGGGGKYSLPDDGNEKTLASTGSLQGGQLDGDNDDEQHLLGGDGRRGSVSSVRSSLASKVSDVFGRSRAPQVALKRVLIHGEEMMQSILDEAEVQRSLSSWIAGVPGTPSNDRVKGDDSLYRGRPSASGGGPSTTALLSPTGAHPNICCYLDSDVLPSTGGSSGDHSNNNSRELWIAMELCQDSISLQDVINDRVRLGTYLTSKEVLSIALQCCSALAHLHTQTPPVTHWDFKLNNLLVTEGIDALIGVGTGAGEEDGCAVVSKKSAVSSSAIHDICQMEEFPVKLCDFGSASRTYYNPTTSVQVAQSEVELERRTTLTYRSPESLDLWHKKPVGQPCDIWALGVVLYTLLYQEMPFEANAQEILSGYPRRTHPMPMWASDTGKFGVSIKGELLNLVTTRLLVREPESRATIFEVAAELVTLADRAKFPNPWLAVSKLRAPQAQQLPRFED